MGCDMGEVCTHRHIHNDHCVVLVKKCRGVPTRNVLQLLGSTPEKGVELLVGRKIGWLLLPVSCSAARFMKESSMLLVGCTWRAWGWFSHSANYYAGHPGNTPENHPPTEACMINSKQHRGCRIQDPGTHGYWWWKTACFLHSARCAPLVVQRMCCSLCTWSRCAPGTMCTAFL